MNDDQVDICFTKPGFARVSPQRKPRHDTSRFNRMPLTAPVDYIERTRSLYGSLGHADYQWVYNEQTPDLVKVSKPLTECKIALIGSGGVYQRGQVAFHYKDDLSLRIIPATADNQDLRVTHFAYDITAARRDPNAVLPLNALRQLHEQGLIGSANANAYTFMGGIYSSRKVREQIAPELTRRLIKDEVDIAILIPV